MKSPTLKDVIDRIYKIEEKIAVLSNKIEEIKKS
jgi:hypothetical protein